MKMLMTTAAVTIPSEGHRMSNSVATRSQFNLRMIFLWMTIAAIVLATCRFKEAAPLWTIALLIGPAWLIDRPTLRSLVLIVAVVYLPYAWILSLNFVSIDYHWHWFKMWPILPGLLISHMGLRLHQSPDYVSSAVSALVSLGIIWTAVWLAQRNVWWQVGISIGLLAASALSSFVCYALFRA